MNKIKRWPIYTLAGIISGIILGYVLLWGWFFFRMVFLGYGDKGPGWINTMNDVFFYGGLIVGIIGGQLVFALKLLKKHL